MSRRRFLKTAGVAAAGVGAAAAGLGGTANAGYWEGDYWVVEGQNNPNPNHEHPILKYWGGPLPCTEDVYNVQMAVLNHSHVQLVGDFHFGDPVGNQNQPPFGFPGGRIVISKDANDGLVIEGPATIHAGGWAPGLGLGMVPALFTTSIPDLNPFPLNPNLTNGDMFGSADLNEGYVIIRNLTFDGAEFGVIGLTAGRNFEVSGCTVRNMKPGNSLAFGTSQWGIICTEAYTEAGFHTGQTIFGESVVIENNTMGQYQPAVDEQYGVYAGDFGIVGASYPEVFIRNNNITTNYQGDGQTIGIRLAGLQETTTYVENNIIVNPQSNPDIYYANNGIEATRHFSNLGGPAVIQNNTLTGGGIAIKLFDASDCVVKSNQIIEAEAVGIELFANSHNNHIERNNIDSLIGGPGVEPLVGMICHGNNNIIGFNDFSDSEIPGLSNGNFPCIYLVESSSGNEVREHAKLGTRFFPTGTSMCDQVIDAGSNYVHNYDILCTDKGPSRDHLDVIRGKMAAHKAWVEEHKEGEPPYGPPEVPWSATLEDFRAWLDANPGATQEEIAAWWAAQQ
jgi:hypothetical protein